MRLRAKVLLVVSTIAVLVMLVIAVIVPITIHEYSLDVATTGSMDQLGHIDFALSLMINEIRQSVQNLSENPVVRNTDDANFTSFLNASPDTFEYNITPEEQAIIDIFRIYDGAHGYVSSVYMGRENGAFVRAYPRDSPTAYDPRERPWYILAEENPGRIMMTAPYQSVSNDDINIGVVTALLDDEGRIYGVVGIDITLATLTDYLSGVESVWGGNVMVTNGNGTILAARNSSLVHTSVIDLLEGNEDAYLGSASGRIALTDHYMVYLTSEVTGWKLSTSIPAQEIDRFATGVTFQTVLFVVLAIVLLSTIILVVLDRTVVRPISDLTRITEAVTRTGRLDQEVHADAGGEIGALARSFKGMLEKLRQDEIERSRTLVRIEENLEQLAALNDRIRNPLTVIMAVTERERDGRGKDRVVKAVKDIDDIVTMLDSGWEESAKVRNFLKRHGHIDGEGTDDENPVRR